MMFFIRYAEGAYYDAAVWGRRVAEVYCTTKRTVFSPTGWLSGTRLPVPVRLSGWPAGYPVSGFRSGFPAGRPVIRYPASGPGPVFRLAGRLSGTRLPVPVRLSGWPAGYPVPGFRSRSGFRLAGRLSGTRLPVPVRLSGWPAGIRYLAPGFRFPRFPVLPVSGLARFPTIPRNSGSVFGFGLCTAPFM